MSAIISELDKILSGKPGEYEGMNKEDRSEVIPMIISLFDQDDHERLIAGVDFGDSINMLRNLTIEPTKTEGE